jgi:polysaccharide biosynthesis transport protein
MSDDSEYRVKEQMDAVGGYSSVGHPGESRSGELVGGGRTLKEGSVVREVDIHSFIQTLDYMKIIRGMYRRVHIVGIAIGVMILIFLWPAIRSWSKSGSHSAKAVLRYQRNSNKAVSPEGSLFQLSQFRESTALDMITYPDNLSDLADFLGEEYSAYGLRDSIEISADRRHAELVGVRVLNMPDEETAIRAANALVNAVVKNSDYQYRTLALEKYEEFRRQRQELDEQLKQQEMLIQEFQQKHGLLNFSTQHEVYLATMNSTATRLSDAKVNLSILQTRMKTIKGRADELPDEVSQSTLEDNPIRRRIENAEAALTEARTQFAEQNPKVLRIEREIAELRKLLVSSAADGSGSQTMVPNPRKQELQAEVELLENEELVELQRIAQLQAEFDRLQAEYRKMPMIEKEYKALLERKAELDALSLSFKTSEQAARLTLDNNLSDFIVLEPATRAYFSRSQLPKILMVLAVLVGFSAGLMLILIQELMDGNVRTVKQLELGYMVPCLAAIPVLPGLSVENEYQKMLPFVRDLSERMLTLLSGRKIRSLGFFSSADREGKSVLSFNLARYYASLGRKVCYLNFCRDLPAVVQSKQGAWRSLGLESYLRGESKIEEVTSGCEGVDTIHIAAEPEELVDLYVGPAMIRLRDLLASRYDFVIVEAPAVMRHAESGILASLIDQFVYVVSSEGMAKRKVSACIRFLEQRGHAPFATVLNQADPYFLGDVHLGSQVEEK